MVSLGLSNYHSACPTATGRYLDPYVRIQGLHIALDHAAQINIFHKTTFRAAQESLAAAGGTFAFILVKGIVPVGLMPGSLASGSMYTLCHDDLRSIALFDLLAAGPQHKPVNDHHPDIQQHHGHHGHIKMGPDMDAPAESPAAAHDYPDGNCNFANSFAKAVLALSIDFLLEPAAAEPSFFLATRELFDTAFIRPLTRAPPLAAAV